MTLVLGGGITRGGKEWFGKKEESSYTKRIYSAHIGAAAYNRKWKLSLDLISVTQIS